jgi:hypothetical protein
MSDSAIDILRTELLAAQTVLSPQIRGLDELSRGELNTAALSAVNQLRRQRNTRLDLIVAALAAIDALDDDGYPNLERFPVTPEIAAYFQAELAALEAAFAIFGQPETGDFNPNQATFVRESSSDQGTET